LKIQNKTDDICYFIWSYIKISPFRRHEIAFPGTVGIHSRSLKAPEVHHRMKVTFQTLPQTLTYSWVLRSIILNHSNITQKVTDLRILTLNFWTLESQSGMKSWNITWMLQRYQSIVKNVLMVFNQAEAASMSVVTNTQFRSVSHSRFKDEQRPIKTSIVELLQWKVMWEKIEINTQSL
jgi:hypothetical protein